MNSADLNDPPTAVGRDSTLQRGWVCRVDLNDPPTAVGGILSPAQSDETQHAWLMWHQLCTLREVQLANWSGAQFSFGLMTFAVPGPDRRRTDDHGPYPFSDSPNFANRCSTIMAIQPELGLLAQWRDRHHSSDCADSFTAR